MHLKYAASAYYWVKNEMQVTFHVNYLKHGFYLVTHSIIDHIYPVLINNNSFE